MSKQTDQYNNVEQNKSGGEAEDKSHIVSQLMQKVISELVLASTLDSSDPRSQRGEKISLVISVIGILQGSLEKVEGGEEIYNNLDDLYNYSMQTLLAANMNVDNDKLNEVIAIFQTLKGGWDAAASE